MYGIEMSGVEIPANLKLQPDGLVVGGVTGTLQERGNRYGKFNGHANITQNIKHVMHGTSNWTQKLTDSQREALDMIAHKIGRILNGDPNYADSWHDIAGYASLVDKQLEGEDL